MLKIILLLKWKSLKSQIQYPMNFLVHVAGVSLMGFAEIVILLVLTNAFETIGGWTFWEVGFMVAVWRMGHSVELALFMPFWWHSWLVRNGELDRTLVRPVHPIIQIMTHELSVMVIGEFVPAAILFGLTCGKAVVAWNVLNILYLVLVILSGGVIEWAVVLFCNAFDFWFTDASELVEMVKPFGFQATRYPVHIYGRAFAVIMTFVFPYAFMAYYPTHYFFGQKVQMFASWFPYVTPLVAGVAAALAIGFWSLGLRHYQSTGT